MMDTRELPRHDTLPAAATRVAPAFLTWAVLFLLIVAALVGFEWNMLRHVNHEVSDFAANSLLIQDAKRLHLIYGNYSRVGFYHPGPAILYVLAFGELVFHDWLHLVPSPLSGQLLGGILYNAGWMVLICALVRRVTGALAPALLFTALLVFGAASSAYSIINGIWFPHLYFFPYAAMVVAVAPLVHGRADALKALAVSSGFLINGHASFIPMLGVTLIVVLVANTIVSRRDRAHRILSRAWFARNRREIRVACGILFLFFVPLLIATVTAWPGPLWDYIKFGRGNKGNPLPDALKFVGVYWRLGLASMWALLAVPLLAVLLLKDARAEPGRSAFVRGARALAVAFVATTLAVLYYAKVGVDDLNQDYIAVFYYAVPAMCSALVVLCACRALGGRAGNVAAGVLAVAALAGTAHVERATPMYEVFYNQPGVVGLYDKLHAVPGAGRIVLDLDPDLRTWGVVWGNTLGLQAYAKRRHVDLVCINENWHISNTRPARCTPEEVAHNRRYYVQQVDAPNAARGEPDVETFGLALYREGAPPRPFAYLTVKDAPDTFRHILGNGWSTIEGDFVWTDGHVAEINLPPDPARGRMLTLDLGSFVPNGEVRLNVQAFANGRPAGTAAFNFIEIRHRFTLDLGPEPTAPQHIELKIDNPTSPKQFNLAPDTRLLGLSLYGIRKDNP
jgi:hypothetical protein